MFMSDDVICQQADNVLYVRIYSIRSASLPVVNILLFSFIINMEASGGKSGAQGGEVKARGYEEKLSFSVARRFL